MEFDYKQRINTPLADDPIGKLLDNLRMHSVFCTNSTFKADWAVVLPPISNCMMFHLMLEGDATLFIDNQRIELHTGDFVLLPKGSGHKLSDGNSQNFIPLETLPIKKVTQRYETLEFGGQGTTSKLICGAVTFDHPLALKLLGMLPDHTVIKADSTTHPIVQNISELIKTETQQLAVGASGVIARLADILIIAALRQHIQQQKTEQVSWLGALNDERINKAIQLVHNRPDFHWSLDELAKRVGMSRTSFAIQFKRLVGNTPMDYLAEWRMSLAYSKLQQSNDTILSIALDLGYQSESAFSRAFKKVIGKNPGEVRRQQKSDVN